MIQLTEHDVAKLALRSMGLDPHVLALDSPEALANAVRRAASFLCPTTARELRDTVVESLEWIVRSTGNSLADEVDASIEAVIAYGDLRELRPPEPSEGERLYLAPPAFVERRHGGLILLGIRPEGEPLLPSDISSAVQHERHLIYLPGPLTQELTDSLESAGVQRMRMEGWLTAPREEDASSLISAYNARLAASPPTGYIEGLRILDPSRPIGYYKGRWREPSGRDSGRFVARRPRRFGAAAWCYVELSEGDPLGQIDLPISSPLARGCDEAWRLQAATDAHLGQPQEASCLRERNSAVIQVKSPLPSWVQRRWDVLGTPLLQPGALVTYRLPLVDLDEELHFIRRMLWMEERG